ncbi:FAD-dependent oxidoreductase [Kocuria coralli]|uniref:FAD-dependent oxidoreductase n=1 Tax=Kocuria coralli TaxID=1461025 RepID=A0A5J5KZX6_9MICC|nr:FAD-dependent oxidoreductase [Kocuria coralli]KAA9394346.1 FAD-dependent oxidoreductase [Kocuria coralli]
MKDVVIIGGGLAGLAAAWRLRYWDTVVLEAGGRVGGRVRSEKRGQYFLNWGGHVFGGPNTSTHELLSETGTRAINVPGSLAGLSMNDKLLIKGPLQTYPFRIPLGMGDRAAMVRAGMKVSADVFRYARATRRRPGESGEQRQQRIYDFENTRSFQEYLGNISPEAEALFRPTVTRSAGDPEQISAGAGIGYFSLVWNIGQGLSRSILGGPSTLTETIAASQRERIHLNAEVDELVQYKDHVVVRYRQEGAEHEVRARTAVLATPAMVSRKIGVNLPAAQREALGRVKYGSYVSAAFLTNEDGPRPWDRAYGIATPKRSMNVVLNMGNVVRGTESFRQPGGSIMAFSPASLAEKLLPLSDERIIDTYVADLDQVLKGFGSIIEEAHVQRWHTGAPFCFPGRAKIQDALMRPADRVFLAGDYLGSLYTETAITSAFTAAQNAASLLATERQTNLAR